MLPKSIGIGTIVNHPDYGKGVIASITLSCYYIVFAEKGAVEIMKDYDKLELIEEINTQPNGLVQWEEIEQAVQSAIRDFTDIQERVPLGHKWIKGKLTLHPSDSSLKPYELPLEKFFHKIVMLRDRLRVMEQKINANKVLNDEEKVDLQQYISKCYGSLTSFNILFRNEHDKFVGEGA
jgi:hypothetical protein